MKKTKIIYDLIVILVFFSFVIIFLRFIFSGSAFWYNSKEYERPTLEAFMEKFKAEPATIYVYDYETKEDVILDKDFEMINYFEEVTINDHLVGISENKSIIRLGSPSYENEEDCLYLYIRDYQLIELNSIHTHRYYSVSKEDGEKLVEKATEIIQKEESYLEKEREEKKKLTYWDIFVNSNNSNYGFSLDNKLDEYKYIDSDNKIIKLLENINHELVDKSVYKPILRYGYDTSDYNFDFILDKDLEKITFRREWKNRYNKSCFSNASYKISKEDGALIYDSLRREI